MIDDWRVTRGLPTEGNYPYGQFCAHWFQEHPTFGNDGLVSMAWYEYGVRFLQVSPAGTISEVGYFIGAGSVASAAYWAAERIVYVVDYFRGFDIIRYGGPVTPGPAAGPREPDSQPGPNAPPAPAPPRVEGSKTRRPLPGTGVGTVTAAAGLLIIAAASLYAWRRRALNRP